MAPDAQTHVGAFMWFGDDKHKSIDANKEYSQDNLFHTLLGLFNIQTKIYKQEMDMFAR